MAKTGAIQNSRVDNFFYGVVWFLSILTFIIVAYPLWYAFVCSFDANIYSTSIKILPEEFSLYGYEAIFQYQKVWTGYRNSLIYTAVGTLLSLVVTICAAYPLSRRDLKGRRTLTILFGFTMYFSGGLIPTYLLVANLKMIDTIWAMVLPNLVSVYNMIVMRTFFQSTIPDDLREASQIDGCGNIRFLLSILLPLSTPILAVISMYYAIDQWNGYFSALIYLNSENMQPLQMVLREILVNNQIDSNMIADYDPEVASQLMRMQEIMKYSLIIVASVPMLMVYPFVQRYFVRGVMIGAIKG
ncbi:MAG: carbohydrate ABC transporter permease [Christensenellales bacterium]|jgi:putative aldouronate transport system permease protein